MKPLYYHGPEEMFLMWMTLLPIEGSWSSGPMGSQVFLSHDKACLIWWGGTTKQVTVEGPKAAAARLRRAVRKIANDGKRRVDAEKKRPR